MKEDFKEYLMDLDMKNTLIDRVEKIMMFFEEVYPAKDVEDIFVEEYITQHGSREYGSLQLFSNDLIFEAKNFAKDMDDFSYYPLNNHIKLIRITKEKYDFLKATPDSRFNLYFNIDSEVFYELKSTQENCDHLKTIFMKYIKPNIQP